MFYLKIGDFILLEISEYVNRLIWRLLNNILHVKKTSATLLRLSLLNRIRYIL